MAEPGVRRLAAAWRSLRNWAALLKQDVLALRYALLDPRVPLLAKLVVALVVAYALSPIDLIPDFIPVLGYADDLLILPLGIALAIKLIPAPLLAEFRARAALRTGGFWRWAGICLVMMLWAGIGAALYFLIVR